MVHLNSSVERVLLQTLRHQRPLTGSELIVLLRLQIVLTADEFLTKEPLVLLVGTLLALGVHVELSLLRLVVQAVLLHGYLGIAQQVLLLCQLCFSIQNLQVKVAVAKANYHIAFLDVGTFLDHLLHHDAALLGRNLHNLDGKHLTIGAHIVLELGMLHIADGQFVFTDSERRCVVAKHKPNQ